MLEAWESSIVAEQEAHEVQWKAVLWCFGCELQP